MMRTRKKKGTPDRPSKKDLGREKPPDIQELALQGNAEAQFKVAFGLFANRRNSPEHLGKAAELFQKAAEQGFLPAFRYLVQMYEDGIGIPVDKRKTFEWMCKATELGDGCYYRDLVDMYEKGIGTPVDLAKAHEWCLKLAHEGDTWAQFKVGSMFLDGKGTPKDVRKAARWFRKAAEKRHLGALERFGDMCQHGIGVRRNEAEAAYCWRQAAGLGQNVKNSEQVKQSAKPGSAEAMYRHSISCWMSGDPRGFVEWLQKAADKGHAGALLDLGYKYECGYLPYIQQDYSKAIELYRKSRSISVLEGAP
jgi:TPR repeat protein